MSILPIVHIPDPILRVKSKPVERVDDDLQKFIDAMLDTMYDAPGIGLAAVQVGEPLALFTVDCSSPKKSDDEDDERTSSHHAEQDGVHAAQGDEEEEVERNPIVLINPKIVSFDDAPSTYEEGCLSIPDYYAEVERPAGCVIEYLNREGKSETLHADGLLSTCIQHEMDHVNGVLFIDHISKMKRDMVIKKFKKIAKQSGTVFIG